MQEHTQNDNYVEQGKSFLMRRAQRLALRVVPIALVAVTAAHAAATFNTPGGTVTSFGANCSGGGATGSVTGVVMNSNQGVTLSGSANLPIPANSSGTFCAFFDWTGTGGGAFTSPTLPARWNFTITPPAGVTIQGWHLTFIINGGAPVSENSPGSLAARAKAIVFALPGTRTVFDCVSNCGTSVVATDQFINVPNGQAFQNYEVTLEVDVTASSSASARTVAVSVPPGTSIDINVPLTSPPPAAAPTVGAPALSTLILMLTALGMVALGSLLAGKSRRSPFGGS